MPEFTHIAGERLVMFRGEGGRELMASMFAARGAQVEHAICYRRVRLAPDTGELLRIWRNGGIGAVSVMSAESIEALYAILGDSGRPLLAATPMIVPHQRVAALALSLGVSNALVASGSPETLIATLSHLPCPPTTIPAR